MTRRLRWLLAVLLSMGAAMAHAEELTIERMFSDPALSGPRARGVQVSPAGDRVTFLRGRDDDQFQLDLWQIGVGEGAAPQRLVDSRRLAGKEELSAGEKARRERERTAQYHGIVDYSWSPDGRVLLVPLAGELFLVDVSVAGDPAVRKLPLRHRDVIDAKLSPRGRYVSYIHDQNLYVFELATGAQRALTRDGAGPVHNGESEFVAQEEFDQPSGYWWSPDDARIAFKHVDESGVTRVRRMEAFADRVDVVEQRYPSAGDANAAVRLGVLSLDSPRAVPEPRWFDLGGQDSYLPRVNWLPDGRRLAVQRLSRDQQHLDLLFADATSLRVQRVLQEQSRSWIDMNADLRFFQHQDRFVWASDRSGYKQLYLYDLDGTLLRPLTAGDWNIDEVLALDEDAGRIVVRGSKERVEDSQLYAVELAAAADGGPGAVRRLSEGDGWHEASFGCPAELPFGCKPRLYVDTWSDAATPPQVSLRDDQGRHLAWIEANRLDAGHPYAPFRARHVAAEFGALPAPDGQALHYRLLKPAGMVPGRRYPVLLSFYGGPTAQEARNAWPRTLFEQYLAQHGIGVFTLDNRGTARRGRAFSDVLRGRLGTIEVTDQLAGLQWLARQDWVDARHVACFGWSYGGYLSLMLLARSGGQIAAGVAVAPVTDWRNYDTAYVERYLGMPADNPQGYRDSAVFAWLDGLHAPLLLAHGMADDNVLFANSTRLMAALQEQGTLFSLMTYPGGKHGLSTPAMQKHVFRTIAAFLREQLQPDGAPPLPTAGGN